ncbi:GNAT family N-acetyltransferase [Alphaproteobacteria bacterium]|nr:GNAT family N-acetyltransferase [Alphaproteobacteria bacterium]
MYRIRLATDDDGDSVGALIKAAFEEHPGCIYDRVSEFSELDAIASTFQSQAGLFWVAEAQTGGIVGSGGYIPTADNEVELHKVYLDKAARGSGLAQQLLQKIEEDVLSNGFARITLWTDTRFLSGQRFYEKNGYKQQPETRQLDDLSTSEEFNYVKSL